MLLTTDDLWEVITEETPTTPDSQIKTWKKKDAQARAKIIVLVENDQLTHVRNSKTAQEAWKALKDYHKKSRANSKIYYIKPLCNQRLPEGGNLELETHLSSMQGIIEKVCSYRESLE